MKLHLFNIWHFCSQLQAFTDPNLSNFSSLSHRLAASFKACQPLLPASHLKLEKASYASLSPLCSPLPTSVVKGSLQLEGNRPSSRFSIELSEAGCFNKSFPIKGQGTFCEVASTMTLSFGALWWTLSARTSFPEIKRTWQAFTG